LWGPGPSLAQGEKDTSPLGERVVQTPELAGKQKGFPGTTKQPPNILLDPENRRMVRYRENAGKVQALTEPGIRTLRQETLEEP